MPDDIDKHHKGYSKWNFTIYGCLKLPVIAHRTRNHYQKH